MQNRKFNNPKKECKTLKNIEKKTGWVPGAPHKTDPKADPPDDPKPNSLFNRDYLNPWKSMTP